MKDKYYITSRGTLSREENTLYFENESKKVALPVNKIHDITANEGVSLTAGVFNLCDRHNILIHMFSYGGRYTGSFVPTDDIHSGKCVVQQAKYYNDSALRLALAKKIVQGSVIQMDATVNRYADTNTIPTLSTDQFNTSIEQVETISELMSVEGDIRQQYYQYLDRLLPEFARLNGRTKNPPINPGNSALSYLNTLIYSTTITEIHHTRLNQTISFLHEPHERRYSLSLDISEVFKPLIGDRVLLSLTRQNRLRPEHFEKEGRAVLLNDDGKEVIHDAYDRRITRTKKHPKMNQARSWRRWIRLECHKITKHVLDIEEYEPVSSPD